MVWRRACHDYPHRPGAVVLFAAAWSRDLAGMPRYSTKAGSSARRCGRRHRHQLDNGSTDLPPTMGDIARRLGHSSLAAVAAASTMRASWHLLHFNSMMILPRQDHAWPLYIRRWR